MMAAAVDGSAATTAAGQTGQANAAIDGPLPGDQAREQALIELQRALESASANAHPRRRSTSLNADAPVVIQTGTSASAASNDAAAAASARRRSRSGGDAGEGSAAIATPASEAGSSIGASASARNQPIARRQADFRRHQTRQRGHRAPRRGPRPRPRSTPRRLERARRAAATRVTAGRTPTRRRASRWRAVPVGRRQASRRSGSTRACSRHLAPTTPRRFRTDWRASPPILTTAAPEEQAAQIVRSMRLQWRGANGEATLRLQPDHLGQVFVSVRVEQGTVSATVRAETPAAQQWIQQHQQQLRDALDAQGLRVAQFHVTSNPDDRPRRDHEQDSQQDATGRRASRARRAATDDDRRFEIRPVAARRRRSIPPPPPPSRSRARLAGRCRRSVTIAVRPAERRASLMEKPREFAGFLVSAHPASPLLFRFPVGFTK